jgi:uncharacterized integral membrane protein
MILQPALDVAPQPLDFAPIIVIILLAVIVAALVIIVLRAVRNRR